MIQEIVRRLSVLERRIDSIVDPERPRWVDWTPTVDQNGGVAVTVNVARYMVLGDLAVVQCDLDVTAAGVAGNAISIQGQPAAIQTANNGAAIGICRVHDSGTASYVGILHAVGATDWQARAHNTNNNIGAIPNFALANGDVIFLVATYERA